jgi:hypothetical protein
MKKLQLTVSMQLPPQALSLEKAEEIRAAPHGDMLAIVDGPTCVTVLKGPSSSTGRPFSFQQQNIKVIPVVPHQALCRCQSRQATANN